MALQLRRGTNAERLAMTPVNGELIYVTDYELVSTSVTSINTTTDTLTTTAAHGLSVNQQVKYIGVTLNGLTADQVYFVKTAPTITTFTLSTTLGGGTLDITGSFTVDLKFAKTPTTAAGVPLGTGVAPLWIGDGVTVGGVIAAALNLDDLLDVEITAVAEGNTLYYDATTGLWKNTAIITVDDVTNNVTLLNDLAVNGGDITTTQTTASLFNTTATTINVGNGANTELNLGSPTGGSKVVIKPETIVGINATQAVFNTVASTVNAFGFANTLNMGSATSLTTLGNNLSINGTELKINADGAGSPADGFVYFNGTNESLKWNQADSRFEFSDQLYISQTDIPSILERRNVTADINTPLEYKSALRLTERVTDAANNDTLAAGAGITFSRTSGATATTERIFAALGAVWDGATQTVDWGVNWSNDNYTEVPSGTFPGTYTLLQLGSNRSKFYDNSIYINYSAQGTLRTATSIITSNTLVFGSAHAYTAGDRIEYTSTTQNGLTQNSYYYVLTAGLTSTQCQLGLTSSGSAITLTNGTGLTLNFADLINRVGVNMDTPAYTLDVNGDANVLGDITISGVKVDLTTPVHQGQLLYVSNDVTPTITNSSLIPWDNNTYRPNFQGDNGVYGRAQSGLTVTNNTGAVNYTTGDGSGILVAVDSDGQSPAFIGSLNTIYNTTGDHEIRLNTSTNNFAGDDATSITGSNTLVFPTVHGFSIGDKLFYAGPTQNGLIYGTIYYVIATGFTTTQCQVSLTLGGSAVALTNGTGLVLWFFNGISRVLSANNATVEMTAPTLLFNATNTGIAGVDATIEIERGTSGGNAVIKWNETTDSFEWSPDSSTYYDFIPADLTAPFYNGQLLSYRNNEWVNDNAVTVTDAGQRNVFNYRPLSPIAGANTSLYLRKDYSNAAIGTPGVGTYADGAGTAISFAVVSDTQAPPSGVAGQQNQYASIVGVYSATNPEIELRTSIDNGTNNTQIAAFNTTDASVLATKFTMSTRSDIDTSTLTTTATTQVPLITSTRNVMKCVIYIVQSSNVHTVEALVLRTGASTAMVTTYGEMYNTSALATFDADTSGGAIRLLVTPANATSMLFTSVITSLT